MYDFDDLSAIIVRANSHFRQHLQTINDKRVKGREKSQHSRSLIRIFDSYSYVLILFICATHTRTNPYCFNWIYDWIIPALKECKMLLCGHVRCACIRNFIASIELLAKHLSSHTLCLTNTEFYEMIKIHKHIFSRNQTFGFCSKFKTIERNCDDFRIFYYANVGIRLQYSR